MTLEEIRLQALQDQYCNMDLLNAKILDLKVKKIPFLGCVAFVQVNQQLSLWDARKCTMELPAFDAEREKLMQIHQLMLDDFEEEKED